ncbi:MAG: GNAT family N-acetyltransferase [Myxococcales bacterium]|nr:GNAT family N-acetyltransferase [Myxococcales bacterium]MCH7868722.1 GNAT family N-acetyltransferase [Myxococcales bacterium]
MAAGKISVRSITLKEIQPLREKWLVASGLIVTDGFEGDARSRTQHLGAIRKGKILGIVSLFNEPRPAMVEAKAWRLRGLAVNPSVRGEGCGRSLIEGAARHIARSRGNLLWANVPVVSCDFFCALDFEIAGDAFDVHDLDPHHRILLHLNKR